MIKLLFLIHDLGQGGAEKVLINLVNNMDPEKFDITVMALFGGGVNEPFLKPHIRYRKVFSKMIPGNSKLMKLFSPKTLHRFCIKEHYDVEISYLEGPSARVISGCADPSTKTVCWIHCTMKSHTELSVGFRSYREAVACYASFGRMVFVSDDVRTAFWEQCPICDRSAILYNTNDSTRIMNRSREDVHLPNKAMFHLIGVGKITPVKGFDRLARIHKRLCDDGISVRTYILGIGEQKEEIEAYLRANVPADTFVFLGYQTNPYAYVSKCDLFVCASHSEGFSTAATEALIVGTPVCTVEVSGMREMLGENNEYGMVTENNEDALYEGIKRMLTEPGLLAHYKEQAEVRGKMFSTEETVRAVETFLIEEMK